MQHRSVPEIMIGSSDPMARTNRTANMSIWLKRCALGVLTLFSLPGCSVWELAHRTLSVEPDLYGYRIDNRSSLRTYRMWAQQAWSEELSQGLIDGITPQYERGFLDGFVDYVYAGGNGEPPPVPPRRFWGIDARVGDGKNWAVDWMDGYRHGARVANEGGYRQRVLIPTTESATRGMWDSEADALVVGDAGIDYPMDVLPIDEGIEIIDPSMMIPPQQSAEGSLENGADRPQTLDEGPEVVDAPDEGSPFEADELPPVDAEPTAPLLEDIPAEDDVDSSGDPSDDSDLLPAPQQPVGQAEEVAGMRQNAVTLVLGDPVSSEIVFSAPMQPIMQASHSEHGPGDVRQASLSSIDDSMNVLHGFSIPTYPIDGAFPAGRDGSDWRTVPNRVPLARRHSPDALPTRPLERQQLLLEPANESLADPNEGPELILPTSGKVPMPLTAAITDAPDLPTVPTIIDQPTFENRVPEIPPSKNPFDDPFDDRF